MKRRRPVSDSRADQGSDGAKQKGSSRFHTGVLIFVDLGAHGRSQAESDDGADRGVASVAGFPPHGGIGGPWSHWQRLTAERWAGHAPGSLGLIGGSDGYTRFFRGRVPAARGHDRLRKVIRSRHL